MLLVRRFTPARLQNSTLPSARLRPRTTRRLRRRSRFGEAQGNRAAAGHGATREPYQGDARSVPRHAYRMSRCGYPGAWFRSCHAPVRNLCIACFGYQYGWAWAGSPKANVSDHSEVQDRSDRQGTQDCGSVRQGHPPHSASGDVAAEVEYQAWFVTSAVAHHARLHKIMEVTRHRNPASVMKYVRDANSFEDHAGESFL